MFIYFLNTQDTNHHAVFKIYTFQIIVIFIKGLRSWYLGYTAYYVNVHFLFLRFYDEFLVHSCDPYIYFNVASLALEQLYDCPGAVK